ncbi:MAG: TetR/AcrR family transcriptional regulator [Ornithinibacter sp.]
MTSTEPCDPGRLRADAAANRAKLLDAARTVFGREGVAAPLTTVAAEAEVGIATLYRRFPDRESLLLAAYGEAVVDLARNVAVALAEADPWEGFAGLVTRLGEIEARNRGFTHVGQSMAPGSRRTAAVQDRGYRSVVQVLQRAKDAGVLREDITPEDLPVLSFAIAGILGATRDDVPEAWRRHVALFLDACRPVAAKAPLPAPTDPTLLHRAVIRSTRRRESPASR